MMTRSSGTQGWAWRDSLARRRWLHEEFDDLGRDRQSVQVPGGTPTSGEDAARLPTWADEADYDEPGTGCCRGERPNSFPDPRILMSHDWEK
ncbi:MAG TPA: hypothetical protein VNL71_13730 [Chloroflexota bacterium]|nr:hypothetical protein [Chloroflexota bacterium]